MRVDQTKGRRLAELRKRAKLTQPALGAMLEPPMNKQQIYKLENGIQRITADMAVQFAKIFDVQPAELTDKAYLPAQPVVGTGSKERAPDIDCKILENALSSSVARIAPQADLTADQIQEIARQASIVYAHFAYSKLEKTA